MGTVAGTFRTVPTLCVTSNRRHSTTTTLMNTRGTRRGTGRRKGRRCGCFVTMYFPTGRLAVVSCGHIMGSLGKLSPRRFLATIDGGFIMRRGKARICEPRTLRGFSLCLSNG